MTIWVLSVSFYTTFFIKQTDDKDGGRGCGDGDDVDDDDDNGDDDDSGGGGGDDDDDVSGGDDDDDDDDSGGSGGCDDDDDGGGGGDDDDSGSGGCGGENDDDDDCGGGGGGDNDDDDCGGGGGGDDDYDDDGDDDDDVKKLMRSKLTSLRYSITEHRLFGWTWCFSPWHLGFHDSLKDLKTKQTTKIIKQTNICTYAVTSAEINKFRTVFVWIKLSDEQISFFWLLFVDINLQLSNTGKVTKYLWLNFVACSSLRKSTQRSWKKEFMKKKMELIYSDVTVDRSLIEENCVVILRQAHILRPGKDLIAYSYITPLKKNFESARLFVFYRFFTGETWDYKEGNAAPNILVSKKFYSHL